MIHGGRLFRFSTDKTNIEIDSRGHFTANKIQNVNNVKFRSLALVFYSKFDKKLFSSLKIT